MSALPMTLRDLWYALTLSAILVAAILLMMTIHHLVVAPIRKRRKISRRVKEGGLEYFRQGQILKKNWEDRPPWRLILLKALLGSRRLAKIERRLLQADIYQDPGAFLCRALGLGLISMAVGLLTLKSLPAGLLICGGLWLFIILYVERKRRKKTLLFEKQMPDAMELLARSLRAGHTLPSAIELVGEEMSDPMGTEMKIAYEEQKLGISTPEALLHILERVESMDLRYFASAVMIQHETGGNLAELMESIARVIRNRLNLKAKIRGLTAMGRMSANVMIVVPILTFFALMVIAADYEKVLWSTQVGRMLLAAWVVFVIAGTFLLRRIIQAVET